MLRRKNIQNVFEQNALPFVTKSMHNAVLIVLAFCFYLHSFAQTGKAVVEIENIQLKKGGDIAAAVFTSKYFLKMGKQFTASSKEITSDRMILTFENLPAGEYAFVAFQDIDRNKNMKTNFIGYPKEPFGISNNPTILFGPPSFDESKVTVTVNKITTVKIRLR